MEDAFFSADAFDKNRVINTAETESSKRIGKGGYYIISVDVGRLNDLSDITILKVTPQNSLSSLKQVVNLYSLEKMHFEDQAIQIKRLFYKYNARRVVIDGQGLGKISLI